MNRRTKKYQAQTKQGDYMHLKAMICSYAMKWNKKKIAEQKMNDWTINGESLEKLLLIGGFVLLSNNNDDDILKFNRGQVTLTKQSAQ